MEGRHGEDSTDRTFLLMMSYDDIGPFLDHVRNKYHLLTIEPFKQKLKEPFFKPVESTQLIKSDDSPHYLVVKID